MGQLIRYNNEAKLLLRLIIIFTGEQGIYSLGKESKYSIGDILKYF